MYFYNSWFLRELNREVKVQKHFIKNIFLNIIFDLGSLFVYYLTAKAFSPNIDYFKTNQVSYFNFVVIGEIGLMIPSVLTPLIPRVLKNLNSNGVLEGFIYLNENFSKYLIKFITPVLLFRFIRMLSYAFMAVIFFGLKLDFLNFILFIVTILFSLPLFLSLGIISASIVLSFGRGELIITKLTSVLTILAGVYFPLTVFSDKIKLLLIYLSPFGYLLDTVRIILSSNFDIYNLIGRIFGLTIIGILFYAFSVKIMSVSINYSRKNGMNFSSIFNNHY